MEDTWEAVGFDLRRHARFPDHLAVLMHAFVIPFSVKASIVWSDALPVWILPSASVGWRHGGVAFCAASRFLGFCKRHGKIAAATGVLLPTHGASRSVATRKRPCSSTSCVCSDRGFW